MIEEDAAENFNFIVGRELLFLVALHCFLMQPSTPTPLIYSALA
ncbi:MAG: hypothetical protein V1685_05195 [Parcubacteria group bacterium]